MNQAFCAKYKAKLDSLCQIHHNGQCIFWTGTTDKDGYGIINVQLGPEWKLKRVSRLSYILDKNITFSDIDGDDISHICHNRLCILPAHLSAEGRDENNYRKACVGAGQCAGHGDKKDCLLHLLRFVYIPVMEFTYHREKNELSCAVCTEAKQSKAKRDVGRGPSRTTYSINNL